MECSWSKRVNQTIYQHVEEHDPYGGSRRRIWGPRCRISDFQCKFKELFLHKFEEWCDFQVKAAQRWKVISLHFELFRKSGLLEHPEHSSPRSNCRCLCRKWSEKESIILYHSHTWDLKHKLWRSADRLQKEQKAMDLDDFPVGHLMKPEPSWRWSF